VLLRENGADPMNWMAGAWRNFGDQYEAVAAGHPELRTDEIAEQVEKLRSWDRGGWDPYKAMQRAKSRAQAASHLHLGSISQGAKGKNWTQLPVVCGVNSVEPTDDIPKEHLGRSVKRALCRWDPKPHAVRRLSLPGHNQDDGNASTIN
jgi:hypothetical protein